MIDDVPEMYNTSSETTCIQDDAVPVQNLTCRQDNAAQSSHSNDVRINVQDYSDAEDTDVEFDPLEI